MQKWEYCAIVGVRRLDRKLDPDYPAFWSFTVNGVQSSDIRGAEAVEVAKRIAQLGEEGWEMIGGSERILYFKRPKTS